MHLDIGLERSRRNRWIRGVCGGLAHKFGIDAIWVRVGFAIAAFVVPGVSTMAVFLLYVALGLLLPESDTF
jgi:phage shock protein PspC (stress-responsive transcriptional regulator)